MSAAKAWQLWSCSLLLLVGHGRYLFLVRLQSVRWWVVVMGLIFLLLLFGCFGFLFWFAAFQREFWLVGCFFFFKLSFLLLEWLSSEYFCCLLLMPLSSPRSTIYVIQFLTTFWKALNVCNVCCWYLSSSSDVGMWSGFVAVEFQKL